MLHRLGFRFPCTVTLLAVLSVAASADETLHFEHARITAGDPGRPSVISDGALVIDPACAGIALASFSAACPIRRTRLCSGSQCARDRWRRWFDR